jgi:nitroimidazol reductase NimA-like FMN-containing flavoprotein (pyridoxamine 5'-phosphate oxidase superfamily)
MSNRSHTLGMRVCLAVVLLLVARTAATQSSVATAPAPAPASTPAPPPQLAADGKPVIGPSIRPDQAKSAKHPTYPRGWTCAECHEVKFGVDVVSAASRMYPLNGGKLTNDQIWERVVRFLPGRERFVMATVADGQPTATTLDFVLDQDARVFYAVSEKGTEKLLQLRRNPRMSAVRAEGWTVKSGGPQQWTSVQIQGDVELIDAADPRFLPALEKYNLVRISKERAMRRFDIQRITPREIVYFNTTLDGEGYSVYQYWARAGAARQ